MEHYKWVLLVTLFLCTAPYGKADGPTYPLARAPSPIQPLADGATVQLIDLICSKTEDYAFCTQIIYQGLHTPTANVYQLADLTIYQALKKATDVYIFIGNILRSVEGPRARHELELCLNVYRRESEIFADATFYLQKRFYQQMRAAISAGPEALRGCTTDPLIKKNKEMRVLITMATVAGKLLSIMP